MSADKTTVARLCVKIYDSMHGFYERRAEQLMAAAASFVLLCEAANVEPFEAYAAVKNLMVDEIHSERRDHRFAAMKYHIQEELLKDA